MTPAELSALEAVVRAVAREELLGRFRRTTRREKEDGSWLTEADLAMQSRLKSALATQHPGIDLLGEEMETAQQEQLLVEAGVTCREDRGGLWILDPLDGTSNFAAGIPLFAVSLAHLPAITEIRTARETPPLLGLCGREKARSMSGLWCSGGVQFTTEQLAVGANEYWRGLLRQCAHAPSITRATSP